MRPTDESIARTAGATLFDGATALVFLVATCAPLVLTFTRGAEDSTGREQRKARPSPALTSERASLVTFPERFDGWFADQFALRSALVRQHNALEWFTLESSPSERVVRGRDQWVFYADNQTLEQVRGALPFEEDELEAWVAMLEERRRWLAERGVDYVFAIAPAKAQIYPEYLPAGHEPVGPSRFDQLADALRDRSSVEFVDLRPALRAAKAGDRGGDRAYYPLGTHWTARGAAAAWVELVRKCLDRFGALPDASRFEPVLRPDSQGDSWGERLYIEDRLRQEEWSLAVRGQPVPPVEKLAFGRQGVRYTHRDKTDGPHVMLFHDSFGTALKPLLARSCETLTAYWRYNLEPALIEYGAPDLVIELMVERTLVVLDPARLPVWSQERLRSAFEASDSPVGQVAPEDPADAWRAAPGVTLTARGDRVEAGVAEGPDEVFAFARLPELELGEDDDCILRLEVESPGGMLDLVPLNEGVLHPRARRNPPRVFVPPGRQTVYVLARDGDALGRFIGSDETGWVLLGCEARRVDVADAAPEDA